MYAKRLNKLLTQTYRDMVRVGHQPDWMLKKLLIDSVTYHKTGNYNSHPLPTN